VTTIDPTAGRRAVDERLAKTENPRHRSMLQALSGHLRAEAEGSLDGLMDSLVEKPEYHMYAKGHDYGPKGYDAVKTYYAQLIAARRGVLEYVLDRIVLDDDCVVTEGLINAYQPGRAAKEFGFNVTELDATYLVSYRAVIMWPFDEAGLLLGEDGYASFDPDSAVMVPSDELPDVYVDQFEPAEYATVGISR
jgi:hypothetical protein